MIPNEEIRQICDRVIKSGELGRSRTYAAILEYLADHAIAGTMPKEISIAIDVLGRESDFDVGKDSIVRVHIYHLRNKLNTYFARQGHQEKYRIEIPKGQYMLAVTENIQNVVEPVVALPVLPADTDAGAPPPPRRKHYLLWATGMALVIVLSAWLSRYEQAKPEVNPFLASHLWQPLLDDSAPILILVGDYYIMGEKDSRGNVQRMVREFDINSSAELAATQNQGANSNYLNLELGYAPTSSVKALTQVMKVFGSQSQRVKVKMMSELNTNDLVGSHIIYLGLLSGLRSLNDLMFAASGLALGTTYDDLINLDTDLVYNSSSGLAVGKASYHDYGMLSTFPSPKGTQFVLLAGMRDEGLINLAEEVTTPKKLAALEQAIAPDGKQFPAFEALYEVLGYDNTNFEAKLVYNNKLDTKVLWETRLIGLP